MSAWEIIVLVAIVGLAVFGIVWSVRRNKKKGRMRLRRQVFGVFRLRLRRKKAGQ